MEIVQDSVVPFALPLTHDGVAFWMWVMTHDDHWCIL
jgi:hypothetical protein